MSVTAKLEALKQNYDDKQTSMRLLFDERTQSLRSHITAYISQALRDETVTILNESETTRSFVVDRILEIVSDNLDAEKESTIIELIHAVNEWTAKYESVAAHANESANDSVTELNALKQKLEMQRHALKSKTDELQMKNGEMERLQSSVDEAQLQCQTLHAKLEFTLKTAQAQEQKLQQHRVESKQSRSRHDKNEGELKKAHKQIETLRASLIKSESERLSLRKQAMDMQQQCQQLNAQLIEQRQTMESEKRSYHETMTRLQQNVQELSTNNEMLKAKLTKQSHSLSKKMKHELGKTKALCDDVSVLRQQLHSERNISKMYVDELQKIKMELSETALQLNRKQESSQSTVTSQKKKIHKHYQKMVDANMSKQRSEYQTYIEQLTQQYQESVADLRLKNNENYQEQKQAFAIKIHESELSMKSFQTEAKQTMDRLQNKLESLQGETKRLNDLLVAKQNEIQQATKTFNEQQTLHQLQEKTSQENAQRSEQQMAEIEDLRAEIQSIEAAKNNDRDKACAVQSDLQQNTDTLTRKLDEVQLELQAQQNNHRQHISRYKSRYSKKMSVIRHLCDKVRTQARSSKNEFGFAKTSIQLCMDRLFQDIRSAFHDIEVKSTTLVLVRTENGIKRQLSQQRKLQRRQLSYIPMEKAKTRSMMSVEKNMKELDLSRLQNEVDTIRNDLDQAKTALSPRKIEFAKISIPSSIDSSMVLAKNRKRVILQPQHSISLQQNKTDSESFDTATIKRLRNDLQSLESNYEQSRKKIRQKYDTKDDSASASLIL